MLLQCRKAKGILTLKFSDIGEIALLADYILPELPLGDENINNDCVTIDRANEYELIWTIDPLPSPLAHMIGHKDPKILGWYTALINFSDIAANGGTPLGILVSVECPEDTELDFYMRYSKGIKALCDKYGAALLGGNFKKCDKFSATATAIGKVTGQTLTRKGVNPGHKLFVIGETGYFWAAVIAETNALKVPDEYKDKLHQMVCYPEPQIKAGRVLADQPFQVACMDSSDGILNCCYQFAAINDVSIILYENQWKLPDAIEDIYRMQDIQIDNACYNWGEWQLVCAVAAEHTDQLKAALDEKNIPHTEIGFAQAKNGDGDVYSGKTHKKLNPDLLNQRFKQEAINQSIHSILNHYLHQEIFI